MEDIDSRAIVGTKQVLRALQMGTLRKVYLAEDADAFLRNRIRAAAEAAGVQVLPCEGMKALGEACGIDVGAACVGIPSA